MSSSDPSQSEEAVPPKAGRSRRALTPQEIAAQLSAVTPVAVEPAPPPAPLPPSPPLRPPVQWRLPKVRIPPLRSLVGIAGLALIFLFTFSVFLAWGTKFPDSELDSSWYMVLHWAFKNGAQFGTEIIFTYGPLGFLFQGYAPGTVGYLVIAWAAVAAVVVLVLRQISRASGWSAAVQWIWIIVVALLLSSSVPMMVDERLFIVCWSIVVIHFFIDPRPISWQKVAIAIVVAAICLGKFSMAMVSTVAMGLVSIDLVYRRKIPWLLFIWLVAMLMFWVMAGQDLQNVAAYLAHAFEIASGYAQAAGLFTATEARDVTLFLVVSLVWLATLAYCQVRELVNLRRMADSKAFRDARARCVLVVGGLLPALLLLFKIGYVRHDEHETIATMTLAVLSLIYCAAQWPGASDSTARGLLVSSTVLCLALAGFSYATWWPREMIASFTGNFGKAQWRSWMLLTSLVNDRQLHRDYEALLAEYHELRPLQPQAGTFDGFSFFQRSMLASGLDYRPRPVFQGYLAYTPKLARLNAEHFRRDGAPQYVWFDLQQIDTIFPLQMEASVWPELLGRYRVIDIFHSATLLQRNPQGNSASLQPLSQSVADMGQWIKLPPTPQPVWARIKLERTIAGGIVETLYKPPDLRLQVKWRDGSKMNFGIIPRNLDEGFVLSPTVIDRRSLPLFYSDRWKELLKDREVEEFRIFPEGHEDGSTFAYDRSYTTEFYELHYPKYDLSSIPGFADMLRLRWMQKHLRPLRGTASPTIVSDGKRRSVLVAAPNSAFGVEVPAGATVLHIEYGILVEPYQNFTLSPVTFAVYAGREVRDRIQTMPLWTRRLDPMRVPMDRGIQYQDIQLPIPPAPLVVLETIRGDSPDAGGSYWAEVEFR